MACMSKKFAGLALAPTTWDTRAAIGTADTPAEPISGFVLPPSTKFINLPNNTPPAVPPMNATNPKQMIRSVCTLKKCSALIVKPVPVAKKIVTVLINAF